jgi:hypothetical protein
MCRKYNFVLVVATFLLSISTAFAQVTDPEVPCPGDTDDPNYDPNACHLPLDTWVYVLVIAAVIYGAYKLHQKQKALTA